jgi:hypothetical protein
MSHHSKDIARPCRSFDMHVLCPVMYLGAITCRRCGGESAEVEASGVGGASACIEVSVRINGMFERFTSYGKTLSHIPGLMGNCDCYYMAGNKSQNRPRTVRASLKTCSTPLWRNTVTRS